MSPILTQYGEHTNREAGKSALIEMLIGLTFSSLIIRVLDWLGH